MVNVMDSATGPGAVVAVADARSLAWMAQIRADRRWNGRSDGQGMGGES